MTKKFIIATFVTLATLTPAMDVVAAPAWYVAKVVRAGAEKNGDVRCEMTHTTKPQAFKNKLFQADARASEEVLATCLMAIGMGIKVRVRADIDEDTIPAIRAIYLNDR